MSEFELAPKAVLSFLQATTNTFWNIENALEQNEIARDRLLKAREDASVVIRSMREAFPSAVESIDMIQPGVVPLEVERGKISA